MANLNPNIPLENGARLIVATRPRYNDAETEMTVRLELRTPQATDYLIARREVTVRNGPATSDRLVKNTPSVGGDVSDRLAVQTGALTLAADVVATLTAAFDGGAGATGKREALLTALYTAGVVDSTSLPKNP